MQEPLIFPLSLSLSLIYRFQGMDKVSIDDALRGAPRELARYADELLDIRESALRRQHPGRCVACYFRLAQAVEGPRRAWLARLRDWIESHLEILARDSGDTVLERMPVRLQAEDLESYCQQVMDQVHFDRSYQVPEIELTFEFREERDAPAFTAAAR